VGVEADLAGDGAAQGVGDPEPLWIEDGEAHAGG
jgi:hypothetical protein